jgi:hypothetical protein
MSSIFSEVSLFEQGQSSDPFYASGSQGSAGESPGTFSRALANKVQVKKSFVVKNSTQMLPNTSSIYYFNFGSGQWNIPTASISDHVGPFSRYSLTTFSVYPTVVENSGTEYIEDAKAFDAYGRCVVSGSAPIYTQTALPKRNQAVDIIGQVSVSSKEVIPYLLKDYPKCIQRAPAYSASVDETFEIGTDAPFLIEKAVFEIPFKMGPTWFQDYTVTSLGAATGTFSGGAIPYTSTYFDKGGPAITLSLFCQKNYGTSSIRDLVLTGTITHADDSKYSMIARPHPTLIWYPGWLPLYFNIVEPYGLGSPAGVVSGTNGFFTGSVQVKTEASVSNGSAESGYSFTILTGSIDPASPLSQYTQTPDSFVKKFYNTNGSGFYQKKSATRKELGLDLIKGTGSGSIFISSLDAFGRGMTGFAPSGGSIFGGEYVTPQDPNVIENPFYVDPENLTESSSSLAAARDQAVAMAPDPNGILGLFYHVIDVSSFSVNNPSPYLINPGEKLVLALTKTRPAVSASGHSLPDAGISTGKSDLIKQVPLVGSAGGHDVVLDAGTINVTFYGSYVRGGNSYIP